MVYKWRYEGPVMEFDRCICNHWVGETRAVSKEKAQSNLTFQFKKQSKRTARTTITMPGELTRVMI